MIIPTIAVIADPIRAGSAFLYSPKIPIAAHDAMAKIETQFVAMLTGTIGFFSAASPEAPKCYSLYNEGKIKRPAHVITRGQGGAFSHSDQVMARA